MGRRFAEIAFTESVKAAQTRYGTRAANAAQERAEDARDRLGPHEAAFIAARDSFYMASHGTEAEGRAGWPYIQHRGGPAGFLKVLDEHTLGFADFSGNRQYISAGNVMADDRVSLFLMDYANRRRLKIWARAQLIHAEDDAVLLARLALPDYRARVERGYRLRVEAIDWNCPQHITPRFTEDEIAEAVAPLQARLAELEAERAAWIATRPRPSAPD